MGPSLIESAALRTMLSNQDLEALTESDVGRRLLDLHGLAGTVRIEARPSRRVVVDFDCPSDGTAHAPRSLRMGTWPDRTLAEIRQNAERLARAGAALSAVPRALAQAQAPVASVTAVAPRLGAVPTWSAPAAGAPRVEPGDASVAGLFEAWLADALSRRKDHGESVRRSMHKDVLPTIGRLPAAAIDRAQVAAVLARIVERGSVRQAGCVLADLRQMFRWGVQAGRIAADPTATLRKTDFGGLPQARSRRLSDDEVRELAQRMREGRLARHVRHAVWLMLATGVRIGEIALARWADIDLEARTWTIPADATHSGRLHVVPLSTFAIRHFLPPGETRRSDTWVFPGRWASEPLSPKALGKQIRDRQRGSHIRGRASGTTTLLLSGGAWTPLDLRRTASAMMEELGVRPDVIAACLDQSVRGDGRRGAPSAQERGDAFERLGERLDAIERSAARPDLRAA